VGNIGFYDARIPYENIRINSGMVIIRPDPDCISPEYNHQLFKYLKSDFDVFATGSAQPQLPIRDLKEISFFLPPLPKQHAIAGVLSSLDDKIDLLHRQNKTLEGIADALWRQMFVEEAKEDWKEIKLDSVIGIMSGYNHSINEIRDFGDYLLSMGSIIKTYGIDLNATRFINSENISSQYLCKTGDIIITTRDITQDAELLGSPGIIPKYLNTKNIYAGSNLYKLEIKENKLNKNLLYWLLRSELYRSFVKEIASGTSVLMLKKSDLMNFTFKLPPNNILKRCENEISDVQEKLENNFTQIRTLVLLREALLPKLMSGEVRVKI
jgi:type I restriction enzyme S subunit